MVEKSILKLSKRIIELAKTYAEKHNKSLSHLVENYFNTLVKKDMPQDEISPNIIELSGVICLPDNIDIK